MTVIHRFQATAKPNSYDPETRRFTVVVASSAPVERGSHLEIIDFDAFFAAGLPESLPLQTDHSTSVRDTIGRLSNFRIERDGQGVQLLLADGTLSSRADNEALAANIKDGIQSAFSIAFSVSRWREGKDPSSGRKTRTALAGRLIEGSLVVSPADPNSQIRKETAMPQAAARGHEPDENNPPENVQLRSLALAAGVAETIIDAVLATDATTDQKMQTMLATLNAKPTVRATSNGHNEQTLDNPIALRRAAVEAFDAINRNAAPEGAAAAVFADGEVAFARRLLRMAGQEVGGLPDSVVLRNAAATSDYALIAGATFNLSMRREYEAQGAPISQLFGSSRVTSFNVENSGLVDWTTLAIGDKLESGEYKYSYVDESGEKIFVATIGGVTAISRELSINAGQRLGNMGQKYGQRLAADIADRMVAFVEQSSAAGPMMSDGNRVFHASRGNIVDLSMTETAIVPTLMSTRSAMAKRKGRGDVMIGAYPTHWLIHSDFEEVATRMLSAVQASAIADVNPIAGKLQLIVEPRLSDPDVSWLVAEPSRMDGATKVSLIGNEAPFTDSRQRFETDAIEFKIRQDFGLGWLEWRSWTRFDHVSGA